MATEICIKSSRHSAELTPVLTEHSRRKLYLCSNYTCACVYTTEKLWQICFLYIFDTVNDIYLFGDIILFSSSFHVVL